MNARNLTMDELATSLRTANSNAALGILDGPQQTLTIQGPPQMMKAADFAELIVATRDNQPVRLKDVATVEDSYQSTKAYGAYNGERAIVLLVQRQPDANTVDVVDRVRKLPAALPVAAAGIHQDQPGQRPLGLDPRSAARRELHAGADRGPGGAGDLPVPAPLRRPPSSRRITMPISLLGALGLLYAFGYSLDNISLLGITLAVGLVVDDAIVMLENIVRHIEDGQEAAATPRCEGAGEMGFTIISISVSLIAVFIPIFFMPGVIGLLFHEFAVIVGAGDHGVGASCR